MLINLLVNAVKFTPKGGTIGLEVEGDAERQQLNFVVWDTGIGIARDDMKRLFQPFVQLDSGLSRHYEGAGLGLTLVYRLVNLHGGSIAVESEIGKGSHFTISLPWKEIPTPNPSPKGKTPSYPLRFRSGQASQEGIIPERESVCPAPYKQQVTSNKQHSVSILIVDDHIPSLQAFAEYLASKGYHLIFAQNGKEAVEQTRKAYPDLILMDIQLPEMNGLEAIRHIRSDDTIKTIPIIAVTALVMPGDRERCLDAGATAYLSKPVKLQELHTIIEKLLN